MDINYKLLNIFCFNTLETRAVFNMAEILFLSDNVFVAYCLELVQHLTQQRFIHHMGKYHV